MRRVLVTAGAAMILGALVMVVFPVLHGAPLKSNALLLAVPVLLGGAALLRRGTARPPSGPSPQR
jgi:hypothetical protein